MIYGKDNRSGITSIEIGEEKARLYFYDRKTEDVPIDLFILWARNLSEKHMRMNGHLHYKYATKYNTEKKWREVTKMASKKYYDFMTPWNPVENLMVKAGYNNMKDIEVKDVPVLSFDIEATTLDPNHANAKVLLITNTFRDRRGNIKKRMFAYDNYVSDKDMINDWCSWVREIDPAFIIGHNIFSYDLPYLRNIAGELKLGVEKQPARFSKRTREFRKDGSQSYSYHNINIAGREIIDTFFLSIKYDIGRKYPNYRLKDIMAYEGLEKEGRQHYDASLIGKNYRIPKEWEKIKAYAMDDADDALSLYDLMVGQFFYYAQHIPKSFQEIINSATGSQLNSLMVRSYIDKKHSIPKATRASGYEGAISFGNAGMYENAYKVDVASLYPSIMLEYGIFDHEKDPEGHLLQILETFTAERLKNKKKAKETGSQYYDALQNAQKVVINSVYGFLGAVGLHFNSPKNAALVTKKGREILTKAMDWASEKGYTVINGDTDSITYIGSKVSLEEDLESLNALYPPKIRWEDDGIFEKVLITKAKNYVLVQNGKKTIKGSALKASMKEPALKQFINDLIDDLLYGRDILSRYNSYAKQIKYLDKIDAWCSKKTITKAVLNPSRTNEQKILDAINGRHVSEGDKIKVFFKSDESIGLLEDFDGDFHKGKLYEKLFKTAEIFDKVIDIKKLPNYKLKRNKEKEAQL